MIRSTNIDYLLEKGYKPSKGVKKYKMFLVNESGKILGISKKSTFENLDHIPIENGVQKGNSLLDKICQKFGIIADDIGKFNSDVHSRARSMYVKIAYRYGAKPKDIAKNIQRSLNTVYTYPYYIKKYKRHGTNAI